MRNKVLRKILPSLLCAVFLLTSFGGCKKNDDSDGGKTNENVAVSFIERNVEVPVGEETQLVVSASDGSSPSLKWSSNNDLIAEVNENGLVRGVSEGNAVIKAMTDAGASALCNVTVTSNETKSLLSVSLSRSTASLYAGDSITVNAVAKYGSLILQSVAPTWESADPSVASVNESGVITGVAAGETEITAKAEYKSVKGEAKIKVTVYSEGVLINPDFVAKTIIEGDEAELAVSVMKDRKPVTEYTVTYTSSDEEVATISGNTLSAKKRGDVDITVNCSVGGENYSFTQKLRVYGKYFVDFYNEDVLVRSEEYKYGETVPIEYAISTGRTLKYYAINGVKIDGDKFKMPDEPVRVDAKYVNDTDDDFTNDFSSGTIFFSQAEIEFAKNGLPVDASGNKANGNGAVKLTGSWASKQFNFEKEVTITESSVMRLRMYRPDGVALIYLGNEKDKTDPPVQIGNKGDLAAGHYTVELAADTWTYVDIPLTCFGEVGTKLSAVSIACSRISETKVGYIYIDEITIG